MIINSVLIFTSENSHLSLREILPQELASNTKTRATLLQLERERERGTLKSSETAASVSMSIGGLGRRRGVP